MKLSFKERQELDQIVAALTDYDNEQISNQVDRLVAKANPLISALHDFQHDEFTKDAVSIMEDGEVLEAAFIAVIEERIKWEYALGIFMNRHSYKGAA
ncbi:hypothetical protein [Atlantibacter subterraneus]|uniref:hypothetical protein n=1 Tax=Atlantibacter subterraneus TaxID=255519 RepID=UPI0028AB8A93|nr:hypothetical protein [Atlantibacter subterranea]